jgi:hypothetical protein
LYLYISLICIEVIIGFFSHGKSEHHYKWTDVGDKESDFKKLDELSECCDEKEEVEEKFELVVKNFGYESKQIVFGIFDKIILVILGHDCAI